jgi:hypothetical protein
VSKDHKNTRGGPREGEQSLERLVGQLLGRPATPGDAPEKRKTDGTLVAWKQRKNSSATPLSSCSETQKARKGGAAQKHKFEKKRRKGRETPPNIRRVLRDLTEISGRRKEGRERRAFNCVFCEAPLSVHDALPVRPRARGGAALWVIAAYGQVEDPSDNVRGRLNRPWRPWVVRGRTRKFAPNLRLSGSAARLPDPLLGCPGRPPGAWSGVDRRQEALNMPRLLFRPVFANFILCGAPRAASLRLGFRPGVPLPASDLGARPRPASSGPGTRIAIGCVREEKPAGFRSVSCFSPGVARLSRLHGMTVSPRVGSGLSIEALSDLPCIPTHRSQNASNRTSSRQILMILGVHLSQLQTPA